LTVACGMEKQSPMPEGADNNSPAITGALRPGLDDEPEDGEVYTPGDVDISVGKTERLPVYYSDFDYGGMGEQAREYLNAFLDKNGFDLEFRRFDGTGDPYQSAEAQNRFIDENISKNAVFMPIFLMDLMDNVTNDPDYLGRFKDLYDTGARYAPNYIRHPYTAGRNEPGELRIMPAQLNKNFHRYLSIIIREDIAAGYGTEVRTAQEYIELLRWLKARDPDSVPGAAVPYFPGRSAPFDLFMPEWGYWSDSGMWYCFASAIGSNDTRPAYSMPEFGRALDEFTGLWREELLYMKNFGRPDSRGLEDSPTCLLYFYDFFDPRQSNDYTGEFAAFDFSGYRIYAMYGGQTPICEYERGNYFSYGGSDAVAGPNTDAGEFLRFLEWLGTRENYISLFYGEEGADYTLAGGRIIPHEANSADMAAILQNLYFLERNEFNAIPVTAPWNYEDEMERIIPMYTLITTREDYMQTEEFYNVKGDGEVSLFNETAEDYHQLMSDLFGGLEIEYQDEPLFKDSVPDIQETQALIGAFIEKQKRHEKFFDDFAEVFDKIYKAAAERNR
jgi:hypothetical protein